MRIVRQYYRVVAGCYIYILPANRIFNNHRTLRKLDHVAFIATDVTAFSKPKPVPQHCSQILFIPMEWDRVNHVVAGHHATQPVTAFKSAPVSIMR